MQEHENQTPRCIEEPCPTVTPKPAEWVEAIERALNLPLPRCSRCNEAAVYTGTTDYLENYRCCFCGHRDQREVVV